MERHPDDAVPMLDLDKPPVSTPQNRRRRQEEVGSKKPRFTRR
jgi:hypothetical protein